MNQEQLKDAIRWLQAVVGPFIILHGWVQTQSQLETIFGTILMIVPLIWGLFVHTQSNAVAVVATIAADQTTPLKGLIMEPSTAGRALMGAAAPKDSPAVIAMAGTHTATQMAGDHQVMGSARKSEQGATK